MMEGIDTSFLLPAVLIFVIAFVSSDAQKDRKFDEISDIFDEISILDRCDSAIRFFQLCFEDEISMDFVGDGPCTSLDFDALLTYLSSGLFLGPSTGEQDCAKVVNDLCPILNGCCDDYIEDITECAIEENSDENCDIECNSSWEPTLARTENGPAIRPAPTVMVPPTTSRIPTDMPVKDGPNAAEPTISITSQPAFPVNTDGTYPIVPTMEPTTTTTIEEIFQPPKEPGDGEDSSNAVSSMIKASHIVTFLVVVLAPTSIVVYI